MRTKKDFFKEGKNPNYYEAFNADDAATLKIVLDESDIEYNDIPHGGYGGNSIRFFVEKKDDETIGKIVNEYRERKDSGDYNKHQFDYDRGLYIGHLKQ
jgi:hypothetical protein